MDKLGRRGDEHRKVDKLSKEIWRTGTCFSWENRTGRKGAMCSRLIRKSSEDEVSQVWVRNTPATRGSCGVHGKMSPPEWEQ